MASDHKKIGVYDYFVDGKLEGFKQHLHVSGKLELASIALKSYQRFETPRDICYALLSDSHEIIQAMAELETLELKSARNNPLYGYFHTHMWQLAILRDDFVLQEKINQLAKNGRKVHRILAAEGKDFFSLLIRGDKAALEDSILRGAHKQMGDPLMEDFIAEMSTYQSKLCWLRGIPVQIDSPLVPMELMPIAPLEHYDDVYDFLQPGWVPPPQGMIGKISRWIRS